MKHILCLLLFSFAFMVNAQEYRFSVSGSASIMSYRNENVVKLMPEVVYHFNKSWGVGAEFSAEVGKHGWYKSISPFARWTFFQKNRWHVFADGTVGYYWSDIDGGVATNYEAGIKPGLIFNVVPHFNLMLKYAFLGYRDLDFEDRSKHKYFDFSTDMIQLGVQVAF